MQKSTRVFPSLPVTFTGQSLISHAGVSVLTGFMDALGFGRLCEERLGQFVPSGARHRSGRLLGSLAAMLAAGGEHASDLDILRSSPGVFGQLPSNATVSRFFERTVANPELFSYGFETLTRELRTRAWDAAGNRNPALSATAADPLIIDIDATLVTSHSDKENVAGTYKGGYGFAPFIASCDYGAGNGSGEILACVLRPGNAGANSAEDHIRVFHTAAAQLPDGLLQRHRGAGRGEGPGPHRQCRGLTEVPLAPAQPRRAVLHQLHPPVRQGPHDRLDHRQSSTGSRPWTSTGTTVPTRGSSTPPTSSRSPITRRAPNCSCAPSRCTPARSRPCSIPTGTGSPRC